MASEREKATVPSGPAFVFDLDGTLIDSVYQHVLAWKEALEQSGIRLSAWRIHRRVGVSGGLFVSALGREIGYQFGPEEAEQLQQAHSDAYLRRLHEVRLLPGAPELLDALTRMGASWAIATSGRRRSAGPACSFSASARRPRSSLETT
jgi:phosphoglycolate phosphatase-like HAD superfamily hydrolase